MPPQSKQRKRELQGDGAASAPQAEDTNETSRKRARNRLSQQHFRERKSLYIKQLEAQIKATTQSESDRNKALSLELRSLRDAVIRARSDLSKVASTIDDIGGALAKVLRGTSPDNNATSIAVDLLEASSDDTTFDPRTTMLPVAHNVQIPFDLSLSSMSFGDSLCSDIDILQDPFHLPVTSEGTWDLDVSTIPCVSEPTLLRQPQQIHLRLPPGHLPISDHSGKESLIPPPNAKRSLLSQHIEALELEARIQLDLTSQTQNNALISRYVDAIMHLCIPHAWPQTTSVWFQSQVPEIIGPIIAWRLNPSTTMQQQLPPDYKPTSLQISVPHSAIIDWVPYTGLRDRVILCYNGSPALDKLMCDMMDHYVIEVDDLSQIIPHVPPESAYFGIWHLFSSIDYLASFPNDSLRPPSVLGSSSDRFDSLRNNHVTEILENPQMLVKLARDIKLHSAKKWRFDSALFEKYPELKFEGYESVVAKGRSYRIFCKPPAIPIAITSDIVKKYQISIKLVK